MRPISLLAFVFLCFLTFSGCGNQNNISEKPANLKEITGKIEKANLDKDGNIIIDEDDITTDITYIDYEYEGVTIGLLAVRDSKDKVKIVVNTCQSCGG